MASWGKVDFSQFTDFQRKLQRLENASLNEFCEQCAKELAARLMRKVIKRTPVGEYDDGRIGGTLRRGWTGGTENTSQQGNVVGAKGYINSLAINKTGNVYEVEISNPVEYASYVEFGHRQTPGRYVPALGKKLKAGWVRGKFMLTISEKEIESIAPALLEKRLNEFLKGVFND